MYKVIALILVLSLPPIMKIPIAAKPVTSVSQPKAGLPEIWLAGTSPFVRQKMFQESECDFFDLFKPDAPWSKTAQHVKVFMINGGVILHESDDQVKALFADLKRRHIALAMAIGLLTGRSVDGATQECGVGVEGFAAPGTAKVVANRIAKNGGQLDYVVMDEPLWYAHQFKGKNCCQWPMERIARDIAPRVADLGAKFPNVQIGDVPMYENSSLIRKKYPA